MPYKKGSTSFPEMVALQDMAREKLKDAIHNERARRWKKVVETYMSLLRILSRKNMPIDFTEPMWFGVLMFEVHYHLGIALQHVGEHRLAVKHLSKSLQSVAIPKNGCIAGCVANSCLQTPIYARRAYANAVTGNVRQALRDAEKGVVLDNKNPDMYCIRALAFMTTGDERRAIEDCNSAVKLNPRHVCALILKGTLDRTVTPIKDDSPTGIGHGIPATPTGRPTMNQSHRKASEISSDAANFFDMVDFKSPKVLEAFDRFLYSLNVPHTISGRDIDLSTTTDQFDSADDWNQPDQSFTPGDPGLPRAMVAADTERELQQRMSREAFRCGTPKKFVHTPTVGRRYLYDFARRSHTTDTQRCDRTTTLDIHVKNEGRSCTTLPTTRSEDIKSLMARMTRPGDNRKSWIKWQIGRSCSAMTIYERINVHNAPRMYCKPWRGDKLPKVDREEMTR